MSRPAPKRDAPSSSDSDSDADRRERERGLGFRRRWEGIRLERAENLAQQYREELEALRRANELARIQEEWEDRCHCGRRYSLCTREQRLARHTRPSEIYIPNPTQPRRFVTGIDLTNSDEGVECEFEVDLKGKAK